MKPPKHQTIIELNRTYAFTCDALTHIDMISFLTGASQSTLGEVWNNIRSIAPDLLDASGNIMPEILMIGGKEEFLSKRLSELLLSEGVYVKFFKPAKNASDFWTIINNIWSEKGVVLVTVSVHRETETKPLGHVFAIVRIEDRYFIHDSNLPESIETKKEDIVKMYDEPIQLWRNHAVSIDKRFPIEAICKNKTLDK